jgi:hypothetical protein
MTVVIFGLGKGVMYQKCEAKGRSGLVGVQPLGVQRWGAIG